MWDNNIVSNIMTGVFDMRSNTGGIHIHTLPLIMINTIPDIPFFSLIKNRTNFIIKILIFIYKTLYYTIVIDFLIKINTNFITKINNIYSNKIFQPINNIFNINYCFNYIININYKTIKNAHRFTTTSTIETKIMTNITPKKFTTKINIIFDICKNIGK